MRLRSTFVLGLALAGLAAAAPARAQEDERIPPPAAIEGIPVGPVYFKPFLGFSISEETNPFYQPVTDPDVVTKANTFLGVMVPFYKSYFRASADAIFRHYGALPVTDPNSSDWLAELSLLFGSFDRLVLRYDLTAGASEVLRFDGGETTYDGTPFRYALYMVGAERDVRGHFGYETTVTYSRLSFAQSEINFFEFHGYDVTGDALLPVSPTMSIVTGVRVRRYDHVQSDDPTHSTYRKENSDLLRAGVRGDLPGGGRYYAILAYDRSLYPGGIGADFRGVIGTAAAELSVGPSTTVTARLSRRPWSSFYGDNNYYIANTVGAAVRHDWARGGDVGASVDFGNAAYPDPVVISAGGPLRRDQVFGFAAHATLALQRRVGLRFAYTADLRNSNDPAVEFTAQTLGVQLVLGWR